MKGYQVTFFTRQDQRHGHTAMCEWLLQLAQECGAAGGTLVSGKEGFDRAGLFHSSGFFELADQPQAITVSVDETTCNLLFERINKEDLTLSYVKIPVEFGRIGGASH